MKFFKLICSTLFILGCVLSYAGNDGYEIKIKVKGYKDTTCYLAFHYGNKKYMEDTTKFNSNGVCVFKGKDTLPGGIYLFILPGKSDYFEFLVNEDQHFTLKTERGKLVNAMKVSGSKENELFFSYLHFVNKHQGKANRLRAVMRKYRDKPDSAKIIRTQLEEIDSLVKSYRNNFMEEHSNTLLAKIFKTMKDPQAPPAPTDENGNIDSTFKYRYYKNHFLDNIDFSDNRLLRTPVFHKKLKTYVKHLTLQQPDSVIKTADLILGKAEADKEVFKYCLIYLLNNYANSKIMGMDKVFVHLVENYYDKGKAYWADSTTLYRLSNRAKNLKPTLIGKKAPNMTLQDTSGKYITLYNVEAKYTILCFWDPTCSHCKTAIPKLKKVYDEFKDKGVEVYAPNSQAKVHKWRKFIRNHNLNWINVADPDLHSNFRHIYDINATPKIYLLDENKKIIAKQLSVKQLRKLLEHKLSTD